MTRLEHHLLIIDSDQYSGNFERELTALLTGVIDEGGVGGSQARLFAAECAGKDGTPDFTRMLRPRMVEHDDSAYQGYCTICDTPGMFNDGYGNHYPDTPEGESAGWKSQTEGMLRMLKANEARFRNYEASGNWDSAMTDKAIADLKKSTDLALLKGLVKYPACLSVGIFLNRVPEEWELDWIRNRLQTATAERLSQNGPNPVWTGIRVLKVETVETQVWPVVTQTVETTIRPPFSDKLPSSAPESWRN